jgi:hypothetical protein
MINVLPKEEKDLIKKEYRLRLITVHLVFISLMFVASIGLLFPSYLYSQTKVNSLNERLMNFNQAHPGLSEEDLSKVILDVNNTLTILSKGGNKFDISNDTIGLILSLRTQGITFSRIAYSESNASVRMVDISGVADNRESLRIFQAKMESSPNIASADLPISNFTKRTNIDFKISIKMK